MIIRANLNDFFNETLHDLPCHYDTKAYIVSIYDKYKKSDSDLSKDSVTLLYARAKEKQDFSSFQEIGDWVFFTKSLFPEFLTNASEEYYSTLARLSYYSCFNLINKQWRSFEELADNFIMLENEVKNRLSRNSVFAFSLHNMLSK